MSSLLLVKSSVRVQCSGTSSKAVRGNELKSLLQPKIIVGIKF